MTTLNPIGILSDLVTGYRAWSMRKIRVEGVEPRQFSPLENVLYSIGSFAFIVAVMSGVYFAMTTESVRPVAAAVCLVWAVYAVVRR